MLNPGVHHLTQRLSPASANLHLTAIRQWFAWLASHGALASNPALDVRSLRLVRLEGKTPVLTREQARRLFESLDIHADPLALRDRALLAVMLFGFVRVGALTRMRVQDFEDHGNQAWLVLREKGGKQRRMPAHPQVASCVRSYLAAGSVSLSHGPSAPLFQSAPRRSKAFSGRPLDRSSVLGIVKRHCQRLGLPSSICNHSFRATGITLYQENGGDLSAAAELAGHADTRTTQLYVRRSPQPLRDELERIQL